MKSNVESALHLCGRDRVMQNERRLDNGKASIAIRWDEQRVQSPDDTRFLVRDGDTIDEAGEAAARAFAKRLRERSRDLADWASGIERALEKS